MDDWLNKHGVTIVVICLLLGLGMCMAGSGLGRATQNDVRAVETHNDSGASPCFARPLQVVAERCR